jgi:type IV pilus assembly protein PilE
MIVVVVVGILAAVAVPAYRDYILRSRRADGKDILVRLQTEQEKYRTNNTTYATTLAQLGYASGASTDGYYLASISGVPTATAFSLSAAATTKGKQSSDTSCTPLTVAVSNGVVTKGPAGCW